jgi:hypothetical protein
LELVHDEPKFLCVVQTSLNTFMLVVELSFEGNIFALLCRDGTNYCISSGSLLKSCIYYGLIDTGIFTIA